MSHSSPAASLSLEAMEARYREALAPFEAEAARLRPPDAEAIDAHTHLGLDEDGRSLTLEQLIAQLDRADVRRACVFPLHDPERKPAYSLPNDRVLGWAAESAGRLTPFCRLDPAEEPVAEGTRCLEAGARGIKLHPRAQAFAFDRPEMDDIFSLAEEADVPILIHAGRGLPPLADGLVDLALRHPSLVLILAHAAICDQGIITSRLADHPGVLYDSSCFYTMDLLELLARVPAERVVFASDPPYGMPATGLYMVLRAAKHARLDEPTIRTMIGGTIAGVIDGTGLPTAKPPRRPEEITFSGRLGRVYNYISMTGPMLFSGNPEAAVAMLDLGIAACRDPDPGSDGEDLELIGNALSVARALIPEESQRRHAIDLVFRSLVHAATAIPDPVGAVVDSA